ncbi:MAG TPA: TraB/GumN family protein [Candidatus Methanomethylophilaceae archaeon]|nr:TraB/GumN family protein [Candidatus Methanomethylophilaceae archaeon]
MMLLIIGTGHVFKIEEPISFIVKNYWPDAVLVELDEKRYQVMDGTYEHPKDQKPIKIPRMIKRVGSNQDRTSSQFGTNTGFELLEACKAGEAGGAEVILMDGDAVEYLLRMWREMSFFEKLRFRISGVKNRTSSKKKAEDTQKNFSEREKEHMKDLRRRYPTMMRILHDERNEMMANKIIEASKTYNNMIAVVGDAHVEGLIALLPEDMDIKKIRLAEIRDGKAIEKIMSDIWYDRFE